MMRSTSESKALWGGLAAPGAALLLVLFVIPLFLLIAFSFGTTNIIGQPQFGTTLINYELVFRDYNLAVVLRTLFYAATATLLCLLIGYPYAYFVARFGGKYAPALIAAVILPWLVDYLVRIYAWRQLLSEEGILNQGLTALGFSGVSWIGTPISVIIGLTYSYLPLMILPLYAALNDFDESLLEAGKDLYGGPVATFWTVTFPSTLSGVAGGIILVFLPALGDFATAQFLGGAQTTMLGNIIADQFTQSGSATFGAALAVSMIVFLIFVLSIVLISLRKRRSLMSLVGGGGA
ncbi:ABC transporter permease [Leucobacter sp. W1153]|uniref:ABC transporter permease n=1 Tax=Leucobacter sp. W1153 TaxID=3439064 RepID=UPI003F38FF36